MINEMNNNDAIIKARNITVRYDDRTILENVSFDVKRGEIFVIVGGSGCGKSTLLRQLIGLEKPTEGEIFIDEEDFTQANGKDRKAILRKFGVLFQSSGLFASMTLAENISLLFETYTNLSDDRIAEIIDIKLNSVGLRGFENFLPAEISGGMKKRAGIARAMALDPDILFFDEPSSGLDPVTAADLDSLIRKLNKASGTTMIVVTHDLESIFKIADTIIMLDKSKQGIIAKGSPEKLREQKDDEKVFNFFNRIENGNNK